MAHHMLIIAQLAGWPGSPGVSQERRPIDPRMAASGGLRAGRYSGGVYECS